jgi:hypothetical protein
MKGHTLLIGLKSVVMVVALLLILGTTTITALASPSPVVSVSPSTQEVSPGDSFSINITVDPDGAGIRSAELNFAFDASVMQVDSVTAGNLLGASIIAVPPTIDNTNGNVNYAIARLGAVPVPTTAGIFAIITLTVEGDASLGTYALNITSMGLSNESNIEIPGVVVNDGNVIIPDETPPTYSGILTVPSSPTVYAPGQLYAFSITVEDNVAVDTVIFEFDGVNHTDVVQVVNAYTYQLVGLAAGTHSYRWYMNDTSDNSNSTPSMSYVINKASPTVNLLLNGVDGNLTVNHTEPVNMSATLSIADTITLYVDGVNAGSGLGYVENVTTLSIGTHNITASFTGNGNYTASSETHWLKVASPYRWDINEDGIVDYLDLGELAAHWGETTTEPYPRYDINQDGIVNYIDLGELAEHWGETYN